MTIKKRLRLLLYSSLLFPVCLSGQDTPPVRFVNMGKMAVSPGPNNGTSLFVPHSMKMLCGAEVSQTGRTVLGGNFLHNSDGKVFTTVYDPSSPLTGVFVFSGNNDYTDYIQTITSTLTPYNPQEGSLVSGMMDKSSMFLAFPNVEISSPVKLTSQMGISVGNLEFKGASLLLESDKNDGSIDDVWKLSKDQDASLLVHGSVSGYGTGGEDGHLEIERVVKANFGDSIKANSNRIGFSAPLSNMYVDYFSDHWVYDPQNKKYITSRTTRFEKGRGYFVFIREEDGQRNNQRPEDNVADSLIIQNTKFVFNRSYYPDFLDNFSAQLREEDRTRPQEQLITEDVAVSIKDGENYLGNPYTCAIDIEEMFTSWNEDWSPEASGVRFNLEVGIWSGQASNYLYATPDMSAIDKLDRDEKIIPSQQLFVVKAKTAIPEGISIPRAARVHNAHRFLKSSGSNNDELMLEVREEKLGTYGRLVCGFRPWATLLGNDPSDASFTPSQSGLSPMLYTTASDGKQLSISALPFGTSYMDVSFIAADSLRGERSYQLRATRQESLSTESAILIDRVTGIEQDLFQTPVYEFTSQSGTFQDRFRIVFSPSQTNGIDELESDMRRIYSVGNTLYLSGFSQSDVNQPFSVYSTTGSVVYQNTVSNEGTSSYELNPVPGIYIVKYKNTNIKIKL